MKFFLNHLPDYEPPAISFLRYPNLSYPTLSPNRQLHALQKTNPISMSSQFSVLNPSEPASYSPHKKKG